MKDVIEDLEKATAGSRELDARIAKHIGCTRAARIMPYEPLLVLHPDGRTIDLPHYTTSIDAVRTLFPDSSLWAMGCMEDGPFCRLVVPDSTGSYVGGAVEGKGATVDLSGCIAAIKARLLNK